MCIIINENDSQRRRRKMVYLFVGATIIIYAGVGTYVVKKTIKS